MIITIICHCANIKVKKSLSEASDLASTLLAVVVDVALSIIIIVAVAVFNFSSALIAFLPSLPLSILLLLFVVVIHVVVDIWERARRSSQAGKNKIVPSSQVRGELFNVRLGGTWARRDFSVGCAVIFNCKFV